MEINQKAKWCDAQLTDMQDSRLIHFEAIRIHGVDLDGYAIFHMAKELYSGKEHITVSELSDSELINDKLLRLIVNAFLVRRYGINVIKLPSSSEFL